MNHKTIRSLQDLPPELKREPTPSPDEYSAQQKRRRMDKNHQMVSASGVQEVAYKHGLSVTELARQLGYSASPIHEGKCAARFDIAARMWDQLHARQQGNEAGKVLLVVEADTADVEMLGDVIDKLGGKTVHAIKLT